MSDNYKAEKEFLQGIETPEEIVADLPEGGLVAYHMPQILRAYHKPLN